MPTAWLTDREKILLGLISGLRMIRKLKIRKLSVVAQHLQKETRQHENVQHRSRSATDTFIAAPAFHSEVLAARQRKNAKNETYHWKKSSAKAV